MLDLIPAGKYLRSFAKTGKTVGLTAIKTSIKNAVDEKIQALAEKITPEYYKLPI